jgi:nitrile hydratase accessory protein
MTLVDLDAEGPAAPPRSNGELVFAAPWEGRAFAMALTLHDRGLFEWAAFQGQLINAVARAEAAGGEFSYYRCWLEALEMLLSDSGLVADGSVDERAGVLACRPAGHDHDHHDHDHHEH